MPLGAYMVEYAGGRKIKVPIEYGVTLAAMDRRHAQPMTHSMYRHAGYIATYLADPFVRCRRRRTTGARSPSTAMNG